MKRLMDTGGALRSLKRANLIEDMKQKGVKWVYVSGVDNILAKFVDPLLLGLLESNEKEAALISIEKTNPKEKVGLICKKNNKIGVVEYTEITDELANMRDDYGSLVYADSNSNLYCYRIDELEKVADENLPYHTAFKKATYMDENGKVIKGKEPNAYKFESFIFDSFEMIEDVIVLRLKREDSFAPIKNKEGSDSPETAKKLYNDYILREKCMERYNRWLSEDIFDDETKAELKAIAGNEMEIRDRFYTELSFGTAGLRGIMGAGTNRMNKYTVTKATQGLANYILKNKLEDNGVVICYDTRNNSKEFADLTALCFNANGIRTYVFDEARPIPMLSYTIRLLGATAGVMITASHNPPEYNGYKVMWSDGAQIISPVDNEIIEEVRNIKKYSDIKMMKKQKALEKKLYISIGQAVDKSYLSELLKLQIRDLNNIKKETKIVYSPLHGTGSKPVQKVLEKAGYDNVFVVPEQELPNGNFPTLQSPNPEDPRALVRAIAYAKKISADIVLATDPDCDRVGCAIKDKNGQFITITGNMIAHMMLEYILSSLQEKNKLPQDGAVISTVVSTKLAKKQAESYGLKYFETLTGFKNIARIIRQFIEDKTNTFVFGFEESYGYLFGTQARDKDAVIATLMLCELVTYVKSKNKGMIDYLEEIYKKYGYYLEATNTIQFKGEAGEIARKEFMENIRENVPDKIGGKKVIYMRDYDLLIRTNIKTKKQEKIADEYKTNMVYYELENDSWVAVRPSGTEPKIKIYKGVQGKNKDDAEKQIKKIEKDMQKYESGSEEERKVSFKENKKILGK